MTNQFNLAQGTVRILDDSVLEEYNESIKTYSERARDSLNQFNRCNGELRGSSPLMIIQLINSGALQKGTRLVTREDLENAIQKDNSFLSGNYTDFALALRTAGDSYKLNDLLAKTLAKQLEQRDIFLDKGKLIPLDICSLKENKNSAYGLVIHLKENAESSIRDLRDYKLNLTRNDGLSRANFDGWDWDSYDWYLAESGADGRVVVRGEATTKNFTSDMQKVRSALDAKESFEYQGTLYAPISDKNVRITK